MMNATTTMTIDTFMNADIDLGLSFEIIFVIRDRDSTQCQICLHVIPLFIHSKGSQISKHYKN